MDKPEITDSLLLDRAGERSFERGEGYYHRGAVEELSIRGDHVLRMFRAARPTSYSLFIIRMGCRGVVIARLLMAFIFANTVWLRPWCCEISFLSRKRRENRKDP